MTKPRPSKDISKHITSAIDKLNNPEHLWFPDSFQTEFCPSPSPVIYLWKSSSNHSFSIYLVQLYVLNTEGGQWLELTLWHYKCESTDKMWKQLQKGKQSVTKSYTRKSLPSQQGQGKSPRERAVQSKHQRGLPW